MTAVARKHVAVPRIHSIGPLASVCFLSFPEIVVGVACNDSEASRRWQRALQPFESTPAAVQPFILTTSNMEQLRLELILRASWKIANRYENQFQSRYEITKFNICTVPTHDQPDATGGLFNLHREQLAKWFRFSRQRADSRKPNHHRQSREFAGRWLSQLTVASGALPVNHRRIRWRRRNCSRNYETNGYSWHLHCAITTRITSRGEHIMFPKRTLSSRDEHPS